MSRNEPGPLDYARDRLKRSGLIAAPRGKSSMPTEVMDESDPKTVVDLTGQDARALAFATDMSIEAGFRALNRLDRIQGWTLAAISVSTVSILWCAYLTYFLITHGAP